VENIFLENLFFLGKKKATSGSSFFGIRKKDFAENFGTESGK
jgi:hypothetical protein